MPGGLLGHRDVVGERAAALGAPEVQILQSSSYAANRPGFND
jgi:hypothetical protein